MSPSTNSVQSLQGKLVIVTGASRGIGYGIAYELAKQGAKASKTAAPRIVHLQLTLQIFGTYTSTSSLSALTKLSIEIAELSNGSIFKTHRCDLRNPESAQEIITSIKTQFNDPNPTIDILVNNAGCELVKPLADITAEDFAWVYDLNVRAPLLMTQAILPYLPRQGGRIINIGSVATRAGFAGLSAYCSSKAALEGLTRCWAAELGKNGTSVNLVHPGPVATKMLLNIPQDLVESQRQATPMENRIGEVEEIARVVLWLAEERSG